MAVKFYDRVKETTEVNGQDIEVILTGADTPSYYSFNAVVTDGDTVPYALVDNASGQWEVGYGTFIAPNRLMRSDVKASTNANQKVVFGNGVKDVFITPIAAMFQSTFDKANGAFPDSPELQAQLALLIGLTDNVQDSLDAKVSKQVVGSAGRMADITFLDTMFRAVVDSATERGIVTVTQGSSILEHENKTDSSKGSSVYLTDSSATINAKNVTLNCENFRLGQVASTISVPSVAGTIGDMKRDGNNLYICVATNSWRKIPLLWDDNALTNVTTNSIFYQTMNHSIVHFNSVYYPGAVAFMNPATVPGKKIRFVSLSDQGIQFSTANTFEVNGMKSTGVYGLYALNEYMVPTYEVGGWVEFTAVGTAWVMTGKSSGTMHFVKTSSALAGVSPGFNLNFDVTIVGRTVFVELEDCVAVANGTVVSCQLPQSHKAMFPSIIKNVYRLIGTDRGGTIPSVLLKIHPNGFCEFFPSTLEGPWAGSSFTQGIQAQRFFYKLP